MLAPAVKFKLDDGFTRRWGRRSLLIVPIVLAAWGLMTWEPWNRVSSPEPAESAAPVAQTNDAEQARIQKMLDAAGLALSQGALIEPPGQNALELYRAVLARDPANDLARRGIDSVADELIVQAERALMEQDVTRLASAVDAVRSVRPDHPRLEFFVSQLEQARALQGQSGQPVRAVDTMGRPLETPARSNELPSVRVQAFVQLANDRMRSNQLVGKDGALGYLVSARKIDAADPGVVAGSDNSAPSSRPTPSGPSATTSSMRRTGGFRTPSSSTPTAPWSRTCARTSTPPASATSVQTARACWCSRTSASPRDACSSQRATRPSTTWTS